MDGGGPGGVCVSEDWLRGYSGGALAQGRWTQSPKWTLSSGKLHRIRGCCTRTLQGRNPRRQRRGLQATEGKHVPEAPPLKHLPGAPNTSESRHSTCAASYRVQGTIFTPRRRENRAEAGDSLWELCPSGLSARAPHRRPGASSLRVPVAQYQMVPYSPSQRGCIAAKSWNRGRECPGPGGWLLGQDQGSRACPWS